MNTPASSLSPAIIALLGLAVTTSAHATSYVPVADGDLADQAQVIAEVQVLSIDRSPDTVEPMTEYLMALERLIQGDLSAGPLRVRVHGGMVDGGHGLQLYGAPRFEEDERALLFLKPGTDGTHRILHFMLGAFHLVEIDGQEIALRHFEEARRIDLPGKPPVRGGPRHLGRFRAWLEDRARGLERPADYWHNETTDLPGKFTIATGSNGFKIRWPIFDAAGTVEWRAHEDGQPGLAGGGFAEFQAALEAWNNDPDTPISLVYGGTTLADGGLMVFDGVNAILFDDAAHFAAPFSCATGGVIAVGGPWFTGTHTHNGETFNTALGGDIVTNTGLDCLSIGQPWIAQNQRAEEVFAHELGHALALGHSCGDADSPPCGQSSVLNNALMRANLHGDNRGAALNSDDRMGILFLYGPALIFADGFESGDTSAW